MLTYSSFVDATNGVGELLMEILAFWGLFGLQLSCIWPKGTKASRQRSSGLIYFRWVCRVYVNSCG